MYTVGDFIDRVMATNHEDKRHFDILAQAVGSDPEIKAAGVTWVTIRARPLDVGQVVALAEDMLGYAWEEMPMEPEAIYSERRAEWHAFLKDMHRIATEMGVEVAVEAIDLPITPSEMMVQAGTAKVVDGRITITEKGKAAARQFEREFPEDARVLDEIMSRISPEDIGVG